MFFARYEKLFIWSVKVKVNCFFLVQYTISCAVVKLTYCCQTNILLTS